YGMVLAGMSQYAKDIGMLTSSGIVTAMMSDASDGIMDGMAAGVQVGMGSGMMGSSMRPDVGTAGLAAAMATFIDSSANKSGLSTTDVAALIAQLKTTDGHMH
ncbi:MAG TPA: hypothetical protein VJ743_20005, partial [Albitalea sp.]|nr:hypothetical protein [Albitalea sp.]